MIPEAGLAVLLYLLLGIYPRDNKGEFLEVGDKLLIYMQHAGGDSPPGPQPEVSEASRATVVVAWTPPVGEKEKVHRPCPWRISSGIYASRSPELQKILP